MDKKNQNKDLDGLQPLNAPPLSWEHVEKALNETEEVQNKACAGDNSEELCQNPSQFSIIKESFSNVFGKEEPPKFLWDTIEQDLEAELPSDAPAAFSHIKESFETAFGEQFPPSYLWKALEGYIEQNEEETTEYSIIKESFEQKYSTVVLPLFSWEELVARMDSDAVLADTPDRFSCIKESFEAVYAGQTPHPNVARGILRSLSPLALVGRNALSLLSTKGLKRITIVLLLLVSLLVGDSICWRNSTAMVAEQAETNNCSTVTSSNHIKEKYHSSAGDLIQQTHKETSQPTIKEDVPIVALTNAIQGQKKSTKVALGNPLVVEQSDIVAKRSNEQLQEVIIQTETNGFSAKNKDKSCVKKTQFTNQQHPQNTVDEEGNSTVALPLKSEKNALSSVAFPTNLSKESESNIALKKGTISNSAITKLEENLFTEVRPMIKGRKIHFELGVEGRLGTSLFLVDREKQKKQDIILHPTSAVGVNVQYYLGVNDALSLGVFPYSSVKQDWRRTFPHNKEQLNIQISFVDFTLGYQRTVLHYKDLTEKPASLYAGVSVGASVLTSSSICLNNHVVSSPHLCKHVNWNTGVSIGSKHELQQFVLDYGIIGNIGLNKLITNTKPTITSAARLINVGAYIGLRYVFLPRLAPSKKQREFDWSAPFYIEELPF